jgi:hypothetical protein
MLPLILSVLIVVPQPAVTSEGPQPAASVRMVDVTGDGLLDRLSFSPAGAMAVAVNVGTKAFLPVPQALPPIEVNDVLVTDLDGDGLPDLYLVSPRDNVALLGNGSGAFREATGAMGLDDAGFALSAERLDVDGDGLADLLLHNATGDVLFWALPSGRFARDEHAPAAGGARATARAGWASVGQVDPDSPWGQLLEATGSFTFAHDLFAVLPLDTYVSLIEAQYVNDNAGEVDAADIADGSLTGADVSTTGGDVTFTGAVVTARKGVFGTGAVASGTDATVSGGNNNLASQSGATVGGGFSNIADSNGATVGGGFLNNSGSPFTTISGGAHNAATDSYASIGGGRYHTASNNYATVAGGNNNDATGWGATVGGGRYNEASSYHATVPGGSRNTASADYAFAAGRKARAEHDGAFVWGDSHSAGLFDPGIKVSSAADEFNVYASGGARIFSNTAATAGVLLAPGGNSWSAVSDRDAKEHFTPVDVRAVLDAVAVLPITTWNYKSQDDAVRHMGPMAQDFRAAFGLGVSDTLIDTIDPDGVALAAIQGLHQVVVEKDAEIAELRSRQAVMEAQIAELMER